jgi:hypothetical protein
MITACSGGSSDSSDSTTDPDDELPFASVIADTFIDDPIDYDAMEETLSGQRIERSRIEIVFYDTATVGEVNNLLAEINATVTSSLEGYPSVVVRIPDPGTLQDLETLIADIESRGFVNYVLRSTEHKPLVLPENVNKKIFNTVGVDPDTATEWNTVAHHLAVHAHAAWNAEGALQQEPVMVFMDYFGQGDARDDVFAIKTMAGIPYGFTDDPPPPQCGIDDDTGYGECERVHGYGVLGIAAGKHLGSSSSTPIDLITGMARKPIKLAVVDLVKKSNLDSNARLIQLLKQVAGQEKQGIIVANISLGFVCNQNTNTAPEFSFCREIDDIRNDVRTWIEKVRAAGLENRVLFTTAAGNREREVAGEYVDSYDARTGSVRNAASLISPWPDEDGNDSLEALTNTLVVENVRRTATPLNGAPFKAKCTNNSSFIRGHVSAIGSGDGDIYTSAGKLNLDLREDGGTSYAAPQVGALAAYMSAIDPKRSPQEVIDIITAVATPVPPNGGDAECTNVNSPAGAPLIDAYASVLALDTPGNKTVRHNLLDIAGGGTGGDEPDGVFTETDLELWLSLADPNENSGIGTLNYGRYDLNGDGYEGGKGIARFDLNISDVRAPGAFSGVVNSALNDALNVSITWDEERLTDRQIVCYYAYTDLYTGDETIRDTLMEPVKETCDPCAVTASTSTLTVQSSNLAVASLASDAGICQERTILIDPASATVEPGASQSFTVTVAGVNDSSVTWSATGGTIDANGLYTAGSNEGNFQVTATSVEDTSLTATANVTIAERNSSILLQAGGMSWSSDSFAIVSDVSDQQTIRDSAIIPDVLSMSGGDSTSAFASKDTTTASASSTVSASYQIDLQNGASLMTVTAEFVASVHGEASGPIAEADGATGDGDAIGQVKFDFTVSGGPVQYIVQATTNEVVSAVGAIASSFFVLDRDDRTRIEVIRNGTLSSQGTLEPGTYTFWARGSASAQNSREIFSDAQVSYSVNFSLF